MGKIRQLGHGEHYHLERNDHGKNKHIVKDAGYSALHSDDIVSGHRGKKQDRRYGENSDKYGPAKSSKEVGLLNAIYIVGQSGKGFCRRKRKGVIADVKLSLKGVHYYEVNRGNK